MIKTIIFDWGGTLVDIEHSKKKAYQFDFKAVKLLNRRGYSIELNKWVNLKNKVFIEYQSKRTKTNKEKNVKELWGDILSKFYIPDSMVKDVYKIYESQLNIKPKLKLKKVLVELAERYSLGVISNFWDNTPVTKSKELGVFNLFDAFTVSYKIGIRKPDPQIFLYTLKKLKAEPNSSVFVGNDLYEDIYGASNAGIKTIWFGTKNLPERHNFSIKRLEELLDIL